MNRPPKQAHQNRFLGLQTDMNERDQANSKYLQLTNGRLYQKDGGLLVVDTLEGNEFAFDMPVGYSVLGGAVYNGVAYLVGLSEFSNEILVGTYPGVDWANGGYLESFQLLRNYTDNINYNDPIYVGKDAIEVPRNNLSVSNTYFNWDCKRRLDVLLRESYDGSVNLYLADGEINNKVINSGFNHSTGTPLSRYVSLLDLQGGKLDQFNESTTLASWALDSVDPDGSLKSGQYFFFLRYKSVDGSLTSFVSNSAPIMISASVNNEVGGATSVFGGRLEAITNKSVTFIISNLDNSYRFFQVGFVYFSDGNNQSYIINQEYLVNGTSQVKITGNEATTLVDVATFIATKPVERAAKSHTQLNNTYYGYNWKGKVLHHDDLCDFALAITISEENRIGLNTDPPFITNADNSVDEWNRYNTASDVETIGYFSGESYLFAVHPIFEGGIVGLGYPVTGYDNYYDTYLNPNDKGIFRFSAAHVVPYYDVVGRLTRKRPRFSFGGTPTPWILDNVKGWKISRAPLNKQLIHQGYGCAVYDGQLDTGPANWMLDDDFIPDISENSAKQVPLVEGAAFSFLRRNVGDNMVILGGVDDKLNPDWNDPQPVMTPVADKFALFSTDYLLGHAQGELVPSRGFVQMIAFINVNNRIVNNGASVTVSHTDTTVFDVQTMQVEFGAVHEAKLYNVDGFDYIGNGGFASRFDEGTEPILNGFYRYRDNQAGEDDIIINMPFATPAYIGIDDYAGPPLDNRIVNIWKSNPITLDITTLYDVPNSNFHFISPVIATNYNLAYTANGGDCFVAKSFLKTIVATNNFSDDLVGLIANGMEDAKDIEDGYGVMLGIPTENRYNVNVRVEVEDNKFFPATGLNDYGAFVYPYNTPESNFSNAGYQRVLSPKDWPAWNPNTLGIETDHYPTRIRHTNPQDYTSIVDEYRDSGAAQLQDFDLQYGHGVRIMNKHNALFSFQEKCINLHPINERAAVSGTEGDQIILGESIGLSPYVNRISDVVGLQHQWAAIDTSSGIYGLDYDKRVQWRIRGNQVEFLSEVKGATQFIYDQLTKGRTDKSDYPARLDDEPLCRIGIHAGYDFKNKEVWFTLTDRLTPANQSTWRFSEKLDEFIGDSTFYPSFYLTINEDFYHHWNALGLFYLADAGARSTFFGTTHELTLKYIVDVEGSSVVQFRNQIINSNEVPFEQINFRTEFQFTTLDWVNAMFWAKPQFKEDTWKISIPRNESSIIAEVRANSVLRGRWMEVTLVFNSQLPLSLRDIITFFTNSKT